MSGGSALISQKLSPRPQVIQTSPGCRVPCRIPMHLASQLSNLLMETPAASLSWAFRLSCGTSGTGDPGGPSSFCENQPQI